MIDAGKLTFGVLAGSIVLLTAIAMAEDLNIFRKGHVLKLPAKSEQLITIENLPRGVQKCVYIYTSPKSGFEYREKGSVAVSCNYFDGTYYDPASRNYEPIEWDVLYNPIWEREKNR